VTDHTSPRTAAATAAAAVKRRNTAMQRRADTLRAAGWTVKAPRGHGPNEFTARDAVTELAPDADELMMMVRFMCGRDPAVVLAAVTAIRTHYRPTAD
jgi:hypothetical protein